MGFETAWVAPDQVFYIRFSGVVSIAEIAAVNEDFKTTIQKLPADQRIHIIVNNIAIEKYSFELLQISNFLKNSPGQLEKLGYILVVTDPNSRFSVFLKMISSIIIQMLAVRYRMVNSYAEAITFLGEINDGLSNLPTTEPMEFSAMINLS